MRQLLDITNDVLIIAASLVCVCLVVYMCISLFRKKYTLFKKGLLYTINTLICLVGASFEVRLGIIVEGPKAKTKLASLTLNERRCIKEAINCLMISIIVSAVFSGFNYVYQKFLLENSPRKILSFLFLINIMVLSVFSIVAVLSYYQNMIYEIDTFYKHAKN